MAPLIAAIDWDATLVDENQEWLPGALDALRWFRRQKHLVVIHSARANYEDGRRDIEQKLAKHKLNFKIEAKPYADIYIDDKAKRFSGNWFEILKEVRGA